MQNTHCGHFVKNNMKLSDEQYIAMGMQLEEARRKGGRTVYKKYGPDHFSKLAKLSNKKRAENKTAQI